MVVIQNTVFDVRINEQNLSNILQKVITDLGRSKSELLVRIVDKTQMQTLNKTYRQQDKPTNVLSFASDFPPQIREDTLGDVVICSEVVAAEASIQNKTFKDHLTHLAIHGTLHLLGFNHIDPQDAKQMEALEVQILHKFKIANPY